MENNIKRLLVSAIKHASASVSFKNKLIIKIRQTCLKHLLQQNAGAAPVEEQNFASLMVHSSTPAEPVFGFKERLWAQLTAEQYKAKKRKPYIFLIPAFSAAAVVVLLIGFVFYQGMGLNMENSSVAAVKEGNAFVMQVKPLFFNWGNRLVQSNISTGSTVSLKAGDIIETGKDSMAILSMYNGSTVTLYPGSGLIVNEYNKENNSGKYIVKLRLYSGTAVSSINNIDYTIETPAAEASVAGTEFSTEVINNDQTILATSKGIVTLAMDGDSIQVGAGEYVHAIKGQPLVVCTEDPPVLFVQSQFSGINYCLNGICRMHGPVVSYSPITLRGRTDPEATLTVNGKPVAVEFDGDFSAVIDLRPGENVIPISATSPSGKTSLINLLLTYTEPD